MRLTLSGVCVSFGTITAVSHVSLQLDSRETYALMGPSGSGKSTLLAVISGLIIPSQGTLTIAGDAGVAGPVTPNLQWVFQSSPMLDRRTVVDNVALTSIARGQDPRAARSRAFDLLDHFGLSDQATAPGYTLSGGQRQRAAIARAIAADPDVLLADEPTASLDAVSRDLVCDALDHAATLGALVVVATHDEYVARRCNQIITIEPVRPVSPVQTDETDE
ncbi:MAG: ATP-binding cassette domain-containing protein [Rhodoglobus sp.]